MGPKASSCHQCLQLNIFAQQHYPPSLTFKPFPSFRHLLWKILLSVGFSLIRSLTIPILTQGVSNISLPVFFFFPH